jgi:cytochrome c551/c552
MRQSTFRFALLLLASALALPAAADDLELAANSGCIACHRGAETLIGPSFADVAKRYVGVERAAETLAERIVNGTGPNGVGWAMEGKALQPFMLPSDSIKPDEALRLARWILSLKGEIPGLARYVSERVSVSGLVKTKLDVSIDELQKLPAQDVREIKVVSQSPETLGKTDTFKGVLLRTLLDKAVIAPPNRDKRSVMIVAKATDGRQALYSWCEIYNSPIGDGVLVYFEKNGKTLSNDEGKVAMFSSNDTHLIGRQVRWLNGIEVRSVPE